MRDWDGSNEDLRRPDRRIPDSRLLALARGDGRLKEFHRATAAGRNDRATNRAASACEGETQTRSRWNTAGAPGGGEGRDRSLSGVHRNRANGGAEKITGPRPGGG